VSVVGVYNLINFADVRTEGGYGLMWTKADNGEGGSIFVIFLRMSFMDDPLVYRAVCQFTAQLLLVLTAPTHGGKARLS